MAKLVLVIIALISFINKPLIAMEFKKKERKPFFTQEDLHQKAIAIKKEEKQFLNEQELDLYDQCYDLAKLLKDDVLNIYKLPVVVSATKIHRTLRILIDGGCHRNGEEEWLPEKISRTDLSKIKKYSLSLLKKAQEKLENANSQVLSPKEKAQRLFCQKIISNLETSLHELDKYE